MHHNHKLSLDVSSFEGAVFGTVSKDKLLINNQREEMK